MPDDRYLNLIEQGVDHWNCWRADHPDITPDLSRSFLFEANLRGANLSGINLTRACLIGANLQDADLQGANLSGIYASGANLSRANLTGAELSQANLSEANLTDANLSRATAGAANFTSAQLTGACLEDWYINSATQLRSVECSYVFLRSQPKERCPDSGEFGDGEFMQLLQAALSCSPVGKPEAAKELSGSEARSPVMQAIATYPFQLASTAVKSSVAEAPPPSPNSHTLVLKLSIPAPSRLLNVPFKLPAHISSIPWRPVSGVGLIAIAVAVIISLPDRSPEPTGTPASPRSLTVSNLPALVCDEPPVTRLLDSSPDHRYPDGTEYYGKFVDGAPADGRGVMVYSNGDRYDGEYRDGQRHGCGALTFSSGRRYVGQFQRDQFHGIGVWMLENGDRYIGKFQNDKCEGEGTFVFADGSSKSGRWKNGRLVDGDLSCSRASS